MKTRKDITIFVDMDDVLADFTGRFKERIKANPKIQYPQAEYGFFLGLKPIIRSIESYKCLHERFNVHILTAPSVHNPLCYTEKRVWVEKHLGMEAAQKMIICGYKDLLIGDYLIDDNISGKGQDRFRGHLIQFNEETNDWIDITNYFIEKYIP